jgi:N-formylglutamate amidohydrolase
MTPALFEQRRGSLPVLISFPHSGTYLPQALRARLTAEGQAVPDTDWFVPELYGRCLASLPVHVLQATHSRYVVDLNRPADGAALYPGRIESGVCPTETFAGAAIYRTGHELAATEIADRIRQHWRPYHEALAALRDEILAAHGYCIVWDAHSIRSEAPRLFDGQLPELNLGTFSGRSAAPEWVARIVAQLGAQRRFTHVVDGRFKGGHITRHYGEPARGVHAMQLEIAQRAYMAEAGPPQFDAARAAPLAALIERFIAALAAPAATLHV